MSDLVSELRTRMKDWITGVPYWYTLRDAADEIERLKAIETRFQDLQAVVDAARVAVGAYFKPMPDITRSPEMVELEKALRALDGAPTGDSVPRSDTDCQMYRSTVQQPSDSGEVKS